MGRCKKTMGIVGLVALAICFGLAQVASADLADGLIGYWPYDGNTQDFSGLNNHGTPVGDPTFVAGKVGANALDLDGDDFVRMDGAANDITNNDITLSAWVKTTDSAGDWYSANTSTGGNVALFAIDGGQAAMYDGQDGQYEGYSGVTVNNGQWVMLTYTRSGSTGFIYVDGVQRNTHTANFNFSTNDRWSIGQEWDTDSPSDFLIGTVDEVAMWDRALTTPEIESLYNNGDGRSPFTNVLEANQDSVSVNEEGPTSTNYSIRLLQEPNDVVTVTATRLDNQITVEGGNSTVLTFNDTDWNNWKTITVAAVDDSAVEGAHTSAVNYTIASGDGFYDGGYGSPMTVNIMDNDKPDVTITESNGSTEPTEGGASDSIDVVLNSEPNQTNVTITITVDDPFAETTINGGGTVILTFTPTGGATPWNVPQTVTIAAVQDSDEEGDHASKLTFVLASSDIGYQNLPPLANFWVNVIDDDAAQALIGQWEFDPVHVNLGTRTVADSSTSDPDFAGALNYDSDVEIPTVFEVPGTDYHYMTSTGGGDPNFVIRIWGKNDNWHYLPQQQVTLEAWFAPDTTTNNWISLIGCIQDNAAFERGWVLGAHSGDNILAGLAVGGVSNLYYQTSNAAFAPQQWLHAVMTYDGTSRKLYVDGILDSELQYSGDIFYDDASFVLCKYEDDDENFIFDGRIQELRLYNYALDASTVMNNYVTMPPGSLTTITETGGSTSVSEEGPSSDSYEVVLDSEPSANVLITVDPPDDLDVGAGGGAPITLTFTTANWSTEQTVTVTAVDDADLEGDEMLTIVHSIASTGDEVYDASGVRKVYVNVGDNECGLWGFASMDFDHNCRVDLFDYAQFALSWLDSTMPQQPGSVKAKEGFESGVFGMYPWIQGGNADWAANEAEKYAGARSAKAGGITHNQTTSFEITIYCPAGDITFWRKVSSEGGWDFLRFYIDGNEVDTWSGEEDWDQESFAIQAGLHTFRWTYTKDGSVSNGQDTAWVDDIQIP